MTTERSEPNTHVARGPAPTSRSRRVLSCDKMRFHKRADGRNSMNYPRRSLLTAAGAAAALVAGPRQMLAGWEPNERYPDPAIQILDPSFAKYRIAQASVERL